MLSVDFAPVFIIIGAAGAKLRCGNAFNILSLFQSNNTEFKQESHSADCVGRLSSTVQLQYCLSDEAALARIDVSSKLSAADMILALYGQQLIKCLSSTCMHLWCQSS